MTFIIREKNEFDVIYYDYLYLLGDCPPFLR
jgi:hypothetical protein